MVRWVPKLSKKGGLPCVRYEPRKPFKIGAMIRNLADVLSMIYKYQEVVKDPEVQDRRPYANIESHMPDHYPVPKIVAEMLRQAKGGNLKPGDRMLGDSAFGGIAACVEVKKILGIDLTLVVKQPCPLWFPMSPLHAVLDARYGSHARGHWAVFRTEISNVKLWAMIYCWSNSDSPMYFASTCGDTSPDTEPYMARYEDEYGLSGETPVVRPRAIKLMLEYVSVIDENNKMNNSVRELGIYNTWLVKDPWTRLSTALVGQSLVDMLHGYRVHDPRTYQQMEIQDFCPRVAAAGLKLRDRRFGPRAPTRLPTVSKPYLMHIPVKDENGDEVEYYPLTVNDAVVYGKSVGRRGNNKCWLCRKYRPNPFGTTWCCSSCRTPLCNKERTGTEGREMSCWDEHCNSQHPAIRCNGRRKPKFPEALKMWRNHMARR